MLKVFDKITVHPYVKAVIFTSIIVIILFLLIYLSLNRRKNNRYKFGLFILFLISFGFSCLGVTAGILVGNSREAAVNSTITAILTLVGILAGYLFTKDSQTINPSTALNNSIYIPLISLTIFPISLLYGVSIGAANRVEVEVLELKNKINIDLQTKKFESDLKVYEDSI